MKTIKLGLVLLSAASMIFFLMPTASFAWAETGNACMVANTGDEMNLGLWIGILVIAIAAIGIIAIKKFTKKR